jgi:hypothetical protein
MAIYHSKGFNFFEKKSISICDAEKKMFYAFVSKVK